MHFLPQVKGRFKISDDIVVFKAQNLLNYYFITNISDLFTVSSLTSNPLKR